MRYSLNYLTLIAVLWTLAVPILGALSEYSFTQSPSQYTELTNPIVIHSANADDAISPPIDIGFTFIYDEMIFTQIKVDTNGVVSLDPDATSSFYNTLVFGLLKIAGFWDDLQTNSDTGNISYQLLGTAPNRYVVIQFKDMNWYYDVPSNLVNFQIQLYETSNIISFSYGSVGANPGPYGSAAIGISGSAIGNFISVTPASPTADYSSTEEFISINGSHAPFLNGVTYTFTPPLAGPDDLHAVSLTGDLVPIQNSIANYIVRIRNRGTAAQSVYSVSLMHGDTILSSIMGPPISPGEIIDFPITCTFTNTGPIEIYAMIMLAADLNTDNNVTPPLTVLVQFPGTDTVTIGSGDIQYRIPMDFYWKNGLFECIYLSSEIDMVGLLTSVVFYNNFETDLSEGKPTRIWLGETTASNLLQGWIPTTQLTSVFDGLVSYPNGQNMITVTLTTAFAYTGGNLVMLVHRPMDSEYYDSNDNFYCQDMGLARSRKVWGDTYLFDPAAPPASSTAGLVPKTSMYIVTQGLGTLMGSVVGGGSYLEGVTVHVEGTNLTTTTSATGEFSFPYIFQGNQQIVFSKFGYISSTQIVSINENQTTNINVIMDPVPVYHVTGLVTGSDQPALGLSEAHITLSGIADYNALTDAQGSFEIENVFSGNTYAYTITKIGYLPSTGSITIGNTDYNMGTIILNERANPPAAVQAVESLPNVNLTWISPNSNAAEVTESFENDLFPPSDWSQIVTNNGLPNSFGVAPTWCRAGNIPLSNPITPQNGNWQAIMWWSDQHQDEWLITPQFVCPFEAALSFNGYIYLGSPEGDHYYVKISTDNGNSWDILWDSVAAGDGYSDYSIPFLISLQDYAYQNIQLAWHADDPPTDDGMWNIAAIDNIFIGSPTQTIRFKDSEISFKSSGFGKTKFANYSIKHNEFLSKAEAKGLNSSPRTINVINRNDRALIGYKVWRLLLGEENNETNWSLLTPAPIMNPAYQDTGWSSIPDGTYKWAVKALYTNDVLSGSSFSNAIQKLTQVGTIAGMVQSQDNNAIANATITVNNYSAVTNADGEYSIQVPAGIHTVTCSAAGYMTATQTGIVVVTDQTTTVNFTLNASAIFTDSFETYSDFAMDFPPWINVDVDQSATYGYTGFDFPGEYQPMAFIIFNPLTTTPNSIQQTGSAHGGDKMVHCWAATTPPNNDWLISPLFNIGPGAKASFWARSLTDVYGLERFKVGVSTGGTSPTDFTYFSPGSYVQTPVEWTYFEYDIPVGFIPGNIRVAIQCVSDDAFIFMVDDFVLDQGSVSGADANAPVFATALKGNFPNPFTRETNIGFSLSKASPLVIEIYNVKGQKVKTLINEQKAAGVHQVKWDGTDDFNHSVSSGVYYYKMKADGYSAISKMLLMK